MSRPHPYDEWEVAAEFLAKELGRPPTEDEINDWIEYQSQQHQDDAMEPENE